MSREGYQPYAKVSKRPHENPAEYDSTVPPMRVRDVTDPESAETACAMQIASGSSPPEHAEPEHLRRDESSPTQGNVPLEEDNPMESPAEERPREDEPDMTQSHDIPKQVDQTDEAPEKEEVSETPTCDAAEKEEVPKILTYDAPEKEEISEILTHDSPESEKVLEIPTCDAPDKEEVLETLSHDAPEEEEVPKTPTDDAHKIKVFETSTFRLPVKKRLFSIPTSDASETEKVPGSSTFDISEVEEQSVTSISEAPEAEIKVIEARTFRLPVKTRLFSPMTSDTSETDEFFGFSPLDISEVEKQSVSSISESPEAETGISATHSCEISEVDEFHLALSSSSDAAGIEVSTSDVVDREVSVAQISDTINKDVPITQITGAQSVDSPVTQPSKAVKMDMSVALSGAPEEEEVPKIPTLNASEIKVSEAPTFRLPVKRRLFSPMTSDTSETDEFFGFPPLDISEVEEQSVTLISEAPEAETDISATHSCEISEVDEFHLSLSSSSDAAGIEVSTSDVVDREVSVAQISDTIDKDVPITQITGAQSVDSPVTQPSKAVKMDISVALSGAPEEEEVPKIPTLNASEIKVSEAPTFRLPVKRRLFSPMTSDTSETDEFFGFSPLDISEVEEQSVTLISEAPEAETDISATHSCEISEVDEFHLSLSSSSDAAGIEVSTSDVVDREVSVGQISDTIGKDVPITQITDAQSVDSPVTQPSKAVKMDMSVALSGAPEEEEVPKIPTLDASEIKVFEPQTFRLRVKKRLFSTPTSDASETEEVPGFSTLDISEVEEQSVTSINEAPEAETGISATHSCEISEVDEFHLSLSSSSDAAGIEVSTSDVVDREVSVGQISDTIDKDVPITQISDAQSVDSPVTQPSKAVKMDMSVALSGAPEEEEVPKILTLDASEIKVFEPQTFRLPVKKRLFSTPTSDASETEEVPGFSTLDISEVEEQSVTSISEAPEAETGISATHSCEISEVDEFHLSLSSSSDAAGIEVSTSDVVDREVSVGQISDTIDKDVPITQISDAQSVDNPVTSPSGAVKMDISVTLGDAPEKEETEITSPFKNILYETPHTLDVKMSQLISPAMENKINDEIECQLKKEIQELGENYDVIFTLLKDVRGPLEVKKTFVELAIREASRFERKELIEQLQSFLQKLFDFHQKK